MSGKDIFTLSAVVAAIACIVLYLNREQKKDPFHLGPPAYVDGPNAPTEECKKLTEQWSAILTRHAAEEEQVEMREAAALDQVTHAKMSDAARQLAMNNLTAKEDIARTERENKQENEIARLRELEREAGCRAPTPAP